MQAQYFALIQLNLKFKFCDKASFSLFLILLGFDDLLVSFGRPGPMAMVASGVIMPEVFSSILSPEPST